MPTGLDEALLEAHRQQDFKELTTLYAQAAAGSDGEEAGFFLTQAYVFALDAGDPRAHALHQKLKELGREE